MDPITPTWLADPTRERELREQGRKFLAGKPRLTHWSSNTLIADQYRELCNTEHYQS